MPCIEIKDLKITYSSKKTGETTVFSSLNLQIPDKKITAILGPSGVGKTTLLNVIAGLYLQDSGDVFFDSKNASDLTIRDRDIGYVKQDTWLYPLKTIFDNIAFPLKFCEISTDEVYLRVRDIAKKLNIEQCLTRKPKHISLGQQKRVALARALIKEPSVVLFDEPLTALDAKLKDEILSLVVSMTKQINSTVIYVTHDLGEALKIADHIIVIENQNSYIQGTKEEIMSSNSEFINQMKNELNIRVAE